MEEDYQIKIHVCQRGVLRKRGRSNGRRSCLASRRAAPVLNLERTTYMDRNVIVEYTLSIARADQFRYKVSHVRG